MELEEDIKFEPDKSAFILNTNTTCFLCLRANLSFNGDGGNQGQIDRASLLSICRYLGVNLKELFSNSLLEKRAREKRKFLEKIANCSVKLCEACCSITSKLSSLCLELELLQMKVDGCLQSFLDELENSETDMVRVQRFRKMKVENLEGGKNVDVELAQMLRTKMKEQCNKKFNTTLQKSVIGGSTEEPNGTIPATQKVQTTTDPASFRNQLGTETPVIVKEENYENEDVPKSRLKDDFKLDVESIKTDPVGAKISPKTTPRFEYGKVRPTVTCTICKPASVITDHTLQDHKIRVHVGALLINHKLPNVSPEDFQIYCDHVFKVETSASRKGKGSCIYDCPYCIMVYKAHSSQRNHLFQNHKEILSKKIIELQKSTTVQDLLGTKLPPPVKTEEEETLNCDNCGKTFSTKQILKRHKIRYCKMKSKAMDEIMKIQSPPVLQLDEQTQKCEKCGLTFSGIHRFNQHQKVYCKFKNNLQAPSPECQYCGLKLRYAHELKYHQERFHQQLLQLESNTDVLSTPIAEMLDVELHEDQDNLEAILPDIQEDDPLGF